MGFPETKLTLKYCIESADTTVIRSDNQIRNNNTFHFVQKLSDFDDDWSKIAGGKNRFVKIKVKKQSNTVKPVIVISVNDITKKITNKL